MNAFNILCMLSGVALAVSCVVDINNTKVDNDQSDELLAPKKTYIVNGYKIFCTSSKKCFTRIQMWYPFPGEQCVQCNYPVGHSTVLVDIT